MGFTHYWDMTRDISERNFKKLTKDMKAIEAYIKENKSISNNAECAWDEQVTLHHPNGENEGVLYYSNTFGFNGDAKIHADHESMHINLGANDSWTFCKTARKPYDLAVCLILISLKYHIRSTRVTSDGGNDDWQHSFELWEKIFPKRNVMFRFKKWKSGSKKLDGSLAIYNRTKLTADLLAGKIIS